MGRLTTIEDVEKRRERSASEPVRQVAEAAAHADAAAPVFDAPKIDRAPAGKKSAAQAEFEFHGLDTQEKRSAGHTLLVVAAVIVVIAVAVNFANYTLHFF